MGKQIVLGVICLLGFAVVKALFDLIREKIADAIPAKNTVKTPRNKKGWELKLNNGSTYYSRTAKNLYEANELLKSINSIPLSTYYLVDTMDGTLGRDTNGFFTEAPIKTRRLSVHAPCKEKSLIESQSLTNFGNEMLNLQSVATLKASGQYAKLILMMKCGKCGYESPVETQAGDMERECYNCGAENKVRRGNINISTPMGSVEI